MKLYLSPYKVLLLFFILFSWVKSNAQQYTLLSYSVSEGLAQSEVKDIAQDNLGFLWLATGGGGISRFDGTNFQTFNENNGLGGNIVTSIAVGEGDTVYFTSTWGPVSYYSKGKIYQLPNGLEGAQFVLSHTESGKLFATNNRKIYTYNKIEKEWESQRIPTDQDIHGIGEYDSLHFYYFTDNELFLYNVQTQKSKLFYYSSDKITTVKKNKSFVYLTKEGKGIYTIQEGKEQSYLSNDKLPQNLIIQSIDVDKSGNLWFATENKGAYCYNKAKGVLKNIFDHSEMEHLALSKIFCDNQNNIWMGSSGRGVIKYLDTPFLNYSNVEGLSNNNVFAILEDSKGRIWGGTGGDGVYLYDGNKVEHLSENNVLKNNVVFSIIEDNHGNVCLGTRKGIVKIVDGQLSNVEYITSKDGLVSDAVNFLMTDSGGKLWVATYGGISIIDEDTIMNYSEGNGLTTNAIHTLFEDKSGVVWVGTGSGLLKYYDGNFRRYGVADGLCNPYVGSIVEDKNGVLWLGTDRCISKFKNEKFYNYTEDDGLNSTIIYIMNTDNNGHIWVGTNRGLDKITIDENSEIIDIDFFGKEDGFSGEECNTRGTFRSKNGDLYFATIKGVFKYKANQKENQYDSYPLYLTDIKLFLNPLDSIYKKGQLNYFGVPDSVVLPHNKNHLTFEFLGIDLKKAKDVRYSYKLENFDSTWFRQTPTRYAVYSNIPPGEYIFKVKAITNKVKSSPEVYTCKVHIDSPPLPFYTQWWFALLATLLIVSLYYNFVFVRNRDLKISKEELEQKVKERTEEIQRQNEEKTVLLQEIHHRVKNNLQVINSLFNIQMYYTDEEQVRDIFKESQNRILSMSKIHQTLYESKDFSKLNLKNYISELVHDIQSGYEVENDIELQLDIDEHIYLGIDSVVPFALVVNEILSNAFKYAFKGMNSDKKIITIKIRQDKDKVTTVYIGDNGVGMPPGVHWEHPTTMGMDLIQTLVNQLDGTVRLHSDGTGTNYTIIFTAK